MKHYTETIPVSLAEKLKEKGMPIEIYPAYMPEWMGEQKTGPICPTYAKAFDWLAEKGIWFMSYPVAGVLSHHLSGDWACTRIIDNEKDDNTFGSSWHDAADAAIEKALELENTEYDYGHDVCHDETED